MNNDFEQEFTQNVQSRVLDATSVVKKDKTNILLICLIGIAILQLIVTIIMGIITLNAVNSRNHGENYSFSYDGKGNYSALSAFCETGDNYYEFYNDNTYVFDSLSGFDDNSDGDILDSDEVYANNVLDEGSYSFLDNNTIEIKSKNNNDAKRLSFDVATVKDGDTAYFCNLLEEINGQ